MTAALAALAVLVLLLPGRRLAVARPRAPRGAVDPRLVGVVGAVGVALAVGGRAGLLVAAVVAVATPRAVAALERPPDDAAELAAQLPLCLDLLAACLAGGAAPVDAVRAVAEAVPGACATRLSRVASALAVGCSPAEAWRRFADDGGSAGAAARALARAADSGAPVADAVRRVAQDARRDARARAEQRARRAGVMAVGPLGACFLPAFFLLGVVPAVVGLAAPLLASF